MRSPPVMKGSPLNSSWLQTEQLGIPPILTADGTVGNPTNPAVIPQLTHCYRHFRFKPWTGSWTQIPLAVNDLTGNTSGGVRAVKAFRSLSLDRTSVNCQVVGVLQLGFFFLSEIRDLCHFEDIIHSVGVPVSDPQKYSFNVSLGSTDLK